MEPTRTLYELLGGAEPFERLVRSFYEGVKTDPVLRPLYPEPDLGGAEDRLRLFLIQYWGGPDTYSQERGHPRLRMRHLPFAIGQRERDAWMTQMTRALDTLDLAPVVRDTFLRYFEGASLAMMNRD
ncbi:MAG TPA: globin [Candidatus Dormibacteraeota bacterium]|nr:globin [Candidatus Dormibacteraeota bacterium]